MDNAEDKNQYIQLANALLEREQKVLAASRDRLRECAEKLLDQSENADMTIQDLAFAIDRLSEYV